MTFRPEQNYLHGRQKESPRTGAASKRSPSWTIAVTINSPVPASLPPAPYPRSWQMRRLRAERRRSCFGSRKEERVKSYVFCKSFLGKDQIARGFPPVSPVRNVDPIASLVGCPVEISASVTEPSGD